MSSTHTSRPATLSIGGATYDLFLTMTDDAVKKEDAILLKAGGKLRVKNVVETCGGGACNTSVGLARLGLNAAFCGVIASDQWGERLLATMKAEGVDTAPATVVEHETSSFSIILSLQSGERTILYTPGVNEHLHDTTFDVASVGKKNAVYLNHLSETSCMIEDDIIRTLAGLPDIRLTWNPGGCQIEHGYDSPDKKKLLAVTNLLLLNKEEAMAFARTDSAEKALKILSSAGVKNVCITDGKRGATATDGKKTWHCPVLPDVKVVDTTGAGDAFGTAVTWALLTGLSLPEALIAGTLNGASVVGSIGAQAGLLTDTQITERMKTSPLSVAQVG
jgi:sugar/nucleoside kinase (ribokinase family)